MKKVSSPTSPPPPSPPPTLPTTTTKAPSSNSATKVLFHLYLFAKFLLDALQTVFELVRPIKPNLFLSKNFAPVTEESFDQDLKIEGKDLSVLDELQGEFVRNGPNPKRVPKGGYHWFDGDGMLHGVRIKGRKVNYVNRWVKTNRFAVEEKTNTSLYIRLGEMNGPLGLARLLLNTVAEKVGLIKRLDPQDGGTANTALVYHDGRLLSLVESDHPYAIRLLQDGQLETIGRYSYGGKLRHPFTAHPKVDADTNEMMFIGYNLQGKHNCSYSVVDQKGELVHTTRIPIPTPVMMHDFGITKSYSLFYDLPLEFDPKNMLKGEPVLQYVSRPSRIGVLGRYETTGTRWFTFEPGFFFHMINSWEEVNGKGETEITVLGCRSPALAILFGKDYNTAQTDATAPRPHLYRMNLTTGETFEKDLSNIWAEFPVVHPNRVGKPCQFAFCATFSREADVVFDGFVKFDLSGLSSQNSIQEVRKFQHGPKRYGGEGVFVPRKNQTSEDDGVLMTFVFDENTQKSEFVAYDAKTMSSEPIIRVVLPHRVPYGFHGIFVTEEQIRTQKDYIL